MLEINFPEHHYIHSSASTSDSDQQLTFPTIDQSKNKKLKNELCRNYLNTGFCRYYDKCQFAHGIEELRQSQKTNLKYKTKSCQSYFVKGCCQYGERCNFLHRKRQDEILLTPDQKYREMKKNFSEVIDKQHNQSKLMTILSLDE